MGLSRHDIFTGCVGIVIIILIWLCAAVAIKNKLLTKFLGRKFLHIAAISTCAWAIHSFENRIVLAYIFLTFFVILLAIIRKGWMQVNEQPTYGIALFPLAFAILLFMPVFDTNIIVYAVLILAISDALAGITGELLGKQKVIFLIEKKSWIGFAAFYISAFIISLVYFNDLSFHGILLCSLFALLPALTELFSYRGSDNFSIPLFTAVWVLLITNYSSTQLEILFLLLIGFVILAAYAAYKNWLTVSGATAACWVALLLFTTGGYAAFVAPGIFLVSGSLLSKLNQLQKEKEGRNALQVFANGIVGILFMICYGLTHHNFYLLTAIASFCISMSDSTSSELGVYFKGATYDILSLKKIPAGVSGGISLQGTTAGLAGALLLSFASIYFNNFYYPFFIWISLAGFAGMLTDSILGSLLQVRYKTAEGILTDDKLRGAKKVKGFSWCTNDMVNILSNILITLLFFYILNKLR